MNETDRAALVAAEARVRALRDATRRVADLLETAPTVEVAEVRVRVARAWAAVEADDLGPDAEAVGGQLEAMFDRLGGLALNHPGPVASDSLGLPMDARFLRDMGEYLTRRYGLDEE